MNEKEVKQKRLLFRRKHVNHEFTVKNDQVLYTATLGPYTDSPELLTVLNLDEYDARKLRDLLNTVVE